jgi:hypothetical protein
MEQKQNLDTFSYRSCDEIFAIFEMRALERIAFYAYDDDMNLQKVFDFEYNPSLHEFLTMFVRMSFSRYEQFFDSVIKWKNEFIAMVFVKSRERKRTKGNVRIHLRVIV